MKKSPRRTIWIGLILLTIFLLGAIALWPSSEDVAASLEPSAADQSANLPEPSHPLMKGKDNEKISTLIAETPQANGINGAPQIMKSDLGLDISPLCFEQLFSAEGPKGPVDITTCEKDSGYKKIKTGIEEGRYRSLYEFPPEDDMPPEKGFSSYELLGTIPSGSVVQIYNETGGTGRFSNLLIVKLSGNTLSLVDQITGGDRCNGGLTEARVTDGKLSYTVNVTPGDFPTLAWGDDKGIKPYEDLEASAMSCFATATYTDGKLASVTLLPDAIKEEGDWQSQYSRQKCFNGKFKSMIETGHKTMTAEELKTFMDDFVQSCPASK